MNFLHKKFPKINYIGNKEKLSNWIVESFPSDIQSVLDVFSGGGSVSYALKKNGYRVITNDALYSSFTINKALIENKKVILSKETIKKAILQPINEKQRENLEWLSNNLYFPKEVDELSKLVHYSEKMVGYKKYLFLALLRRAMIRKLPYSRMNLNWNNIVKLRNENYSYKKYGRKRAYHNKSFSYHMLNEIESYNSAVFDNCKENKAIQKDSLEAIKRYGNVDAIYVDPPYPGTMNNYEGFYGAFDKIFDKKIAYADWTNSTNFLVLLEKLLEIAATKTKYVILSLNTNTKPGFKDVINLCMFYGDVELKSQKHNYQVSGKKEKNTNTELLLILKFYK